MEVVLRARLRRWFVSSASSVTEPGDRELALAALLVEMVRADYEDDPREYETVRRMLARRFGLDEKEAERLLNEGERAADRAVSLYEHTRTLDLELDEQEKFAVIEALWETAFADGVLDGNEDYLIHKVADLLHVRHSDLMRIKDEVVRRRDADKER